MECGGEVRSVRGQVRMGNLGEVRAANVKWRVRFEKSFTNGLDRSLTNKLNTSLTCVSFGVKRF